MTSAMMWGVLLYTQNRILRWSLIRTLSQAKLRGVDFTCSHTWYIPRLATIQTILMMIISYTNTRYFAPHVHKKWYASIKTCASICRYVYALAKSSQIKYHAGGDVSAAAIFSRDKATTTPTSTQRRQKLCNHQCHRSSFVAVLFKNYLIKSVKCPFLAVAFFHTYKCKHIRTELWTFLPHPGLNWKFI